jgi:hypothetical protein
MKLAKLKEWLTLASVSVVIVAGGLGGVQRVVSTAVQTAIAPLQADIRAMNGRLDRMGDRMTRMEASIVDIRERLTRVETLLARNTGRSEVSEP